MCRNITYTKSGVCYTPTIPVSSNEFKAVIKTLPANKSSEPYGFIAEITKKSQIVKEALTLRFFNLSHKIQKEEILLKSFYEDSIMLTLKARKDPSKIVIGQYL
jgi:hypothetical protein